MADPLSIAASVVGVTVPALHGTRLLLDDLQGLKDAPKTVIRLVEDVSTVDTALKLLRNVEQREWEALGTNVAEQTKTTINGCTQACDLFRTYLQRWTRHSEDGKLTWQDRANVGFFKQGQIKAMYSSVRNSHITEEIRKTISTKQAEVKGAITTADKQLIVLENKPEEMNLSDDDEETAAPTEGKAEALRQLEEERKALDASRKLLDELLSKSQEEAVANAAGNQSRSTTVTFGNNNSGFQAGTITGGVSGITFGGK